MVTALRNAKSEEQSLSEDEELHLSDDESAQEEVFSGVGVTPQRQGVELDEDSLNLYLGEVGQTPLLSAKETQRLASQIEDRKHLSQLEKDWTAEHGGQLSAIDLVLALGERLSRTSLLFEALCQYLKFPSRGSIEEKVLHQNVRRAIDSKIDQNLSSRMAEITGESQTEIEKSMIEFSLDSRLMPWHVIKEAGRKRSLAEFGEVLESEEFRDKLELRRSQIVKHFEQIRERAQEATNHMIQANLRLVVSVAKRHTGWGVPLLDLIQEGNIGLMQAVRKFDHRRGYKFSTYAIPWIWQAVNRAVNDQSRIVHLPGHIVDDLTKLMRARGNLAQKLGRQPTDKELAPETGLPSKKIESLLRAVSEVPTSLDTPVGEDGSQVGDFIADQTIPQPEEQATTDLLREELNRKLESLTPRERRVIELRFGLGNEHSRTLVEAGVELGLTKERIRQIEKETLAKLRHPNHSRDLIGYLG